MNDDTPPHGFPMPTPTAMPGMNGNGGRPVLAPRARDDTTRYLCAATHIDPDYANDAIRGFLVEETRQVPATTGVDAAAVLGEAVAARTRRKLRDIPLLVLAAAALFVTPVVVLGGWVALSVLLSIPLLLAVVRRKGGPQGKSAVYGIVALAGVAIVLFLPGDDSETSSGGGQFSSDPSAVEPDTTSGASSLIGLLVVVALMTAVLLADRFVVWKHLDERFWPNRLSSAFRPIADRSVFQFSGERFRTQLQRYVHPKHTIADPRPGAPPSWPSDEPAVPLIVYRDYLPFVGAGTPEKPWSIAVPLDRVPDVPTTAELTTESLYAGIRKEIDTLRGVDSMLAPGRRLRDLSIGELVIVEADELIDHLAEPSAADFLRDPGVAPFTLLRRDRVSSIKVDPLEWARYYHCYQVETWDRDVVVSVFVHVAVGRGTLYVEWTPCVLRPIRKKYREIDKMSRSPMRPVGQAVLDLLRLPVSIPGRIRHTFSFLRPLPRDRGALSADMYGVSATLRELAADRDVHNYFQLSDVDRYVKMLESRLTRAVSRTMRAAGYSAVSFDQQAATVINNSVQIGGSVGGNVVAGSGNQVDNGAAPRAATPTTTG